MPIVGPPAAMVPVTSGHPHALPDVTSRDRPTDKVVAPAASSGMQGSDRRATSDEARDQRRGDIPPRSEARRDGEAPSAPPTILQLKIDEMLREQAEALEEAAQGENAEAAPGTRADRAAPEQTARSETPEGLSEPDTIADSGRPQAQVQNEEKSPAEPSTSPALAARNPEEDTEIR